MGNVIKMWLDFDEMITPRIIKVVYWLLLAFTVIGGIIGVISNPIIGIIGFIFSVIGLRVGCEMIILMFNIYRQVKKIADNIPAKDGADLIDKD
ncbi:DUF4282 domain-containing protein [Brenneria goodwinii]|nr:DUF4282 domain-containing protein [Brenneria goodwinii]ATA25470.1 hypothetical protein AWC36_15860 [Brenneria goodwinii]